MKEKFLSFISFIIHCAIAAFLFTFLFRIAEVLIIAFKTSLPHGIFSNELLGIAGDVAAISYYTVIIFLPGFLLFLLNRNVASIFLRIVFSVLILAQFILTIYFIISGILLDDAFYNYSFADIKFITETSGISFSLLIICLCLAIIIIYYALTKFQNRILYPLWVKKIFLPAIILITILHQQVIELAVNGDFGLSIQMNKSFYFLNRTIRHFGKDSVPISGNKLQNEIVLFQKLHNRKDYISKDYPLMAKNNFPDVLAPFFNKSSNKPNLVFIIVESLAKCFSGTGASYGSFTPFLDSLADHSIYFSNFLSTSERTSGVLPSLLGSLPNGKTGFLKLIENGKYPRHFSLLKILKANGYYTSFHYGGWAHFNDYDDFMYEQGIDFMSDEKQDIKDFPWGLPDHSLYKKSFHVIDSLHSPQPRVDVYLTLSMHNPFVVPEQQFFVDEFYKRLKSLPLSESKKEEMKQYSSNLSTVLYADNALKDFFQQYAKRPEFSNTIFFITGDHAMPEIALKDGYLNCYNVPLIIYSPLLKETKIVKAVSSHLDVTPSLLSFLKDNYNLKIPDTVHWIGYGLDTSSQYRNIHAFAFAHNNAEIPDYISGNYFLNGNKVYNISKGFDNKTETTSAELHSQLSKELENFKSIGQYVCQADRIIDARTFDGLKSEDEGISLPVKTVFDFSSTNDTLVYVLDNFSLKNSVILLTLNYSFNYNSKSIAQQSPSIVFVITNNKGEVLNKTEQSFEMNDIRKEKAWNGIPVNGFCSFNMNTVGDNQKRLSVFIRRSRVDIGTINNLRIRARYKSAN